MQSFRYLCIDDNGQKRNGSLRSSDQRSAQRELYQRGWTILTLGEEQYTDGADFGFHALSATDRQRFLFKLSMLMAAGIPIVSALEGVRREEAERFQDCVDAVSKTVEQGNPLSEALRSSHAGYGEAELALIRMGESTGSLVRVLQSLAAQGRLALEREQELKAKLTYPFVQAIVLGAICVLLGAYMGPQLNTMLSGMGVEQPALTRAVTAVLSKEVLWPLAGCAAAGFIALVLMQASPAGRQIKAQLLEAVPLLKDIHRERTVSRFCRMLAQMLESGFDWQRSLKLSRTGSERFDKSIETMSKTLMEVDFEAAVRDCDEFSRLLKSLLLVGYEAHRIPELLELYAAMMDESVDRRIEFLLSILEPTLLFVMGAMVGVVVVASFLPIMNLVHSL